MNMVSRNRILGLKLLSDTQAKCEELEHYNRSDSDDLKEKLN
jgi:hypothetical protein